MKKNVSALVLFTLLLGPVASPILAQGWDTFASEEFDLQFDLPSNWLVEVDGETVIAEGNGIVFVLGAVKDASISTKELFDIQVETLDMDAEGTYDEIELEGGILGIIGSGAGVVNEEVVGIILLAATLDENNYLAYIFAPPNVFQQNEETMVDVITSLVPFGWDEE